MFDFDKIVERRGTGSLKWDDCADPEVLPMWVADMDFETAPVVKKAVLERAGHGVFGYVRVPEDYYGALIGWFERRHGWSIRRDSILYTSGVVPAISATIKALAAPGDRILILTPVYNCFFSSIRNNGCAAEECALARGEDGRYRIDFERLERAAARPGVRALLLCNPHNPGGNVWSAEELARIGEICARHGLTVISDEIHGEFVFDGARYTPFARVNELNRRISVTLTSTSKSFNTAGLQMAAIITEDAGLRARRAFPAAENFFRETENLLVGDIPADKNSRILRDVEFLLDFPHLRDGRVLDCMRIPARIDPPRARREKFAAHGGIRYFRGRSVIPPYLRKDDTFLPLKLALVHVRAAHGKRPEFHAVAHLVGRNGEIVVHAVHAGGAVPFPDPERIHRRHERLLVLVARISLEHHVLVKMEQPRVLRHLRDAACPDGNLDVCERGGIVLHDEDLKPVRQGLPEQPVDARAR